MPDAEPTLQVALEVACTEAEGPGRRYALWVQGCPLRCVGCCNPEFLAFRPATGRTPSAIARDLAAAIADHAIEGLSLLGGEPTAQAEGVADVAEVAQGLGLSVMVYSGFTLAALRERVDGGDVHLGRLLAATDLLVDGPYVEAQRTTTRRFIGSDNQVLHVLGARARVDDPRLTAGNTIELRVRVTPAGRRELVVNGWPVRGARTT